jgi:DNA primase
MSVHKAPGETYAMSPQAQRRLQRHLTDGELRDLAHDIAEALEEANPDPFVVLGEEERAAIFAALTVDR